MPTSRKPPDRRLRRNKPRLVERLPSPPPPDPQASWRRETKERWIAYWNDPVSRAASDADRALVDRYFSYLDEWERSLRAYRRRRFVPGSNEQPVLNPLGRFALELEAKLLAIEDRLGVSPLARSKLGLALGEARKSLAGLNSNLEREMAEHADEVDPRLPEQTNDKEDDPDAG